MRRFVLDRAHDVSGVSGTGVVAEGVEFIDGQVALHWLGKYPTTTALPSIEAVAAIHGHGGATKIMWLDGDPGEGVWIQAELPLEEIIRG